MTTDLGSNALRWDFSLDPLEFTMLMETFGRDTLPYPLRSRVRADTGSDLARQRRAAAERVASLLGDPASGDRLEMSMHTIVAPLYRVEVMGQLAGSSTAERSVTVLRSFVAARADSAVVLVQEPGADASCGGGVHLRFTTPQLAVDHALSPLPPVSPGSCRPITLQRSMSRVGVADSVAAGSAVEQYDRMFRRPRTGVGAVTVARGPALDNRPEPEASGFLWMDFAGDGRYIVHSGDVIEARPAATRDLAEAIGRSARRILAAHG